MEKGAQSYPGQVLAAGGTQVTVGGTKVSTGGTKVSTGRTCKLPVGGMWAGP